MEWFDQLRAGAAIRARDDVLVLNTMFFADEIRDPHDVSDGLPGRRKLPKKQMDTALQLINQLATSWKPEQYHDTHREQVLKLIEQKAKGETVSVDEPAEPEDNVVDLMAALEQSIERARSRKKGGKSSGKSTDGKRAKSGSGKTSGKRPQKKAS